MSNLHPVFDQIFRDIFGYPGSLTPPVDTEARLREKYLCQNCGDAVPSGAGFCSTCARNFE